MARMTPDQRREAIVAAARAVMARQGIAGTTVRDVAAELGTSSGLIHHYVDSMDDLLAEAFARAADEDLAAATAAVNAEATPTRRLARFVGSYGRAESGDSGESGESGESGMQLWLDAWSEAARRPALQATSQRLNLAWHALLQTIIAEGVAAHEFQCDDPDAAAWRLLSLFDGLALQTVAHPNAVAPERTAEWSLHGAELELGLPAGALTAT